MYISAALGPRGPFTSTPQGAAKHIWNWSQWKIPFLQEHIVQHVSELLVKLLQM